MNEGSKQVDKLLALLNSEIKEQRKKTEEAQKATEEHRKSLKTTVRQQTFMRIGRQSTIVTSQQNSPSPMFKDRNSVVSSPKSKDSYKEDTSAAERYFSEHIKELTTRIRTLNKLIVLQEVISDVKQYKQHRDCTQKKRKRFLMQMQHKYDSGSKWFTNVMQKFYDKPDEIEKKQDMDV